jgi:formylglycine-generating enzyme required for sulfatase activity
LLAVVLLGCGRREESQPPAREAAPAQRQGSAEVTTPAGIAMVSVPGGEFLMGDDGGEEDERPAHKVRVDAFYMDKYEVTQKSYEELMGANPSKYKQPERPVEQVSWFNAAKYCNMRSLREGLTPCYDLEALKCDFGVDGYRLPTEAEWEYACRAGTTSPYSFGRDPAGLAACAWFKKNSQSATHPVGQKRPDPWGLHDMHGNVAEWCHDAYDGGYYKQGASDNPTGPASGEERVLRGGSWAAAEEACRSSARSSDAPGFADVCFGYDAYGFRCVRRAPGAVQ